MYEKSLGERKPAIRITVHEKACVRGDVRRTLWRCADRWKVYRQCRSRVDVQRERVELCRWCVDVLCRCCVELCRWCVGEGARVCRRYVDCVDGV